MMTLNIEISYEQIFLSNNAFKVNNENTNDVVLMSLLVTSNTINAAFLILIVFQLSLLNMTCDRWDSTNLH